MSRSEFFCKSISIRSVADNFQQRFRSRHHMSSSKVFSRGEIENRIALGDAIVIFQNNVLRLNKWLKYHPGGDKAVYHLIGRDATDEMIAYHCDDTQSTFLKWRIGIVEGKWENMLPPIQGGKYRTLEQQRLEEKNMDIGACTSDSSTLVDVCETEVKRPRMAGEAHAKIEPKIPQGMIPSLSTVEAFEKKVIKDPSDTTENYDNGLVEQDLRDLPSLDYETQQFLSDEYNKLHKLIIDGGYYQCNYWAYGREALRIGSLLITSFTLLYFRRYVLSAFALGLAWQQIVFIVHDAGHISITHGYQTDNIIGMTLASYIGGLSIGWWKRNHNVHHLITNDPVHDPDIQHLPFFAVSTRLFNNVYSTYYEKFLWFDKFAQKLIPIQDKMYYVLLSFGRFNLYRLSWQHVIMGEGPRHGKAAWFRYYELCGLAFFNWWFFYLIVYKYIDNNWDRFVYVMVSHVVTMIVHVQITLSHFAMSTSDLGISEGFPSRQVRTTMDVDCPEWLDYFHGGLQFQTIHHLFPRVPRHNFRAIQPLVIGFCEKVGLKYSIYGFVNGNKHVIDKLGEIAQQAKILQACTQSLKDEAKREGTIFPELH